jgi:hypothetical protein
MAVYPAGAGVQKTVKRARVNEKKVIMARDDFFMGILLYRFKTKNNGFGIPEETDILRLC